jgi:hypothetical protein
MGGVTMNMSLSDIIALCGHAMLLTAIPVRLAHSIRLRRNYVYILAIVAFVAFLLPVGEMSMAQYSHGIFGDLSIVTIVLLARYLLYPDASKQQSTQLFVLIAMTGLLFYPGALGLGMLDPYRWGYLNTYNGLLAPMLFLALLTMLLLAAYIRRNLLIMLCLVAAVAGFKLQLMASVNIWDYLIDPLAVIYALVSVGVYFGRRMRGRE